MVRALRECWRVLRPGGILLDLRPLAAMVPIERIGIGGVTRIGEVDGLQGLASDQAADRALQTVASERRFVHRRTMRFDLDSYWDSLSQFLDHLPKLGQSVKSPAPDVASRWIENWEESPDTILRTRERMQLAAYARCGIGRCP